MTELRTNTGGFIAGTAQTVISVIHGRFVIHRIMQILIGIFCHEVVNFINVLHAYFSYKILAPKALKPKKSREKLLGALLYKKRPRKTLMKLMAGVNFTNILQAAFSHADPKRKKDTFDLTLFLHFFGLALLKVACKHVDEIDPYEKFPNNL